MTDSIIPTPEADDQETRTRSLDRRNFLKISSTAAAAAAAAAVTVPSLAQDKKQYSPAPRRPGAAKDLKGGWFVV